MSNNEVHIHCMFLYCLLVGLLPSFFPIILWIFFLYDMLCNFSLRILATYMIQPMKLLEHLCQLKYSMMHSMVDIIVLLELLFYYLSYGVHSSLGGSQSLLVLPEW